MNLESVLVRLSQARRNGDEGRIAVADVLVALGERSFGPLLLVPGLIALSPIGAIPGLPGIMAIIELLIAGQMLMAFDHCWLPQKIMKRSIAASRFRRGIHVIRPYARWVDRFVWPRLTILTRGPFFYLIGFACIILSIIMPVIELVPLGGIVPNAALTAFGLALTAKDGVCAIIGFIITAASLYLIASLI